jgi:hypothetical protein
MGNMLFYTSTWKQKTKQKFKIGKKLQLNKYSFLR